MSRHGISDHDLLNLDSFADILTNVVAILVIVVMIGIVTAANTVLSSEVRIGNHVVRESAGKRAFVVEVAGGRVSAVVPPSMLASLSELLRAPGDHAAIGDYDALMLDPQTVEFARRDPATAGDDLGSLVGPDSRLAAVLAELDRERWSIWFVVAPDSYDEFRRARELARAAGFATGWRPRNPQTEDLSRLTFVPDGIQPEMQR